MAFCYNSPYGLRELLYDKENSMCGIFGCIICANIVIYFLLPVMENFLHWIFGQWPAEERREKSTSNIELEGERQNVCISRVFCKKTL